jgi:uncharacterized Zn finger protein
MNEGLGEFTNAAEKYAEVLGKEGLAEFRRLAEEAWSRIPVLRHRRFDGLDVANRFNMTLIMESLARQSGKVEEAVRMLERDLSSPARYLRIAQRYLEAGKADRALDWAEQGLKAFPKQSDAQLEDFLVERYIAAGRQSDVMNLAWANFVDRPSVEVYQHLKRRAEQVGQWPVWREEALELLRERAATEAKKARADNRTLVESRSAATLVDILLAEGDDDAAWREAQGAALYPGRWLRLAEAREAKHPTDAIQIYQRHVNVTFDHPPDPDYEDAVKILRRLARLMVKMGRTDQFHEYYEKLRTEYRRKRNLMRLLDNVAWP